MPNQPKLEVSISEQDKAKLEKLIRELRAMDDKKIKNELRLGLRKAAIPAQQSARTAARNLPAKDKSRPKGLRAGIARNTVTQVKLTGDPNVRIRVRRAAGKASNLARKMNRPGSWRHPVYLKGKRRVWVTQTSRAGWFDDSQRSQKDNTGREIKAVVDRLSKQLKV